MREYSSQLLVSFTLLALAAAGGCTKYEYVIVDPPDFAGRITHGEDTVFRSDAAEYVLRAVDSRLVMQIYNFGDAPLSLVGQQSSVVDQYGESHPLPALTIEPGSFARLILPPPPPTVERTGPSFNVGVGYRYGYYSRPYPYRYRDRGDRYRYGGRAYGRYAYYDPFYYGDAYPRYYRVYDTSNPFYWEWRGEGQVRLKLSYAAEGKTHEDRFVINRVKA